MIKDKMQIVLEPSLPMHKLCPSKSLDSIIQDLTANMAGLFVCTEGLDYLKDLCLVSKKYNITKLGRRVIYIYHYSKSTQVHLLKPAEQMILA